MSKTEGTETMVGGAPGRRESPTPSFFNCDLSGEVMTGIREALPSVLVDGGEESIWVFCVTKLVCMPLAVVKTAPDVTGGFPVSPEAEAVTKTGAVPIRDDPTLLHVTIALLAFGLKALVTGVDLAVTTACLNKASCPCCILDIGALTS